MPRILDKFDNTVRDVNQDVYDQWIQQTERFASAPDTDPDPSVIHEEGQSNASDLVGTGKATTEGFGDGATPAPQAEQPAPSATPDPRQIPPQDNVPADEAPPPVAQPLPQDPTQVVSET